MQTDKQLGIQLRLQSDEGRGDTGNDKMAEPATVQVAVLKLRKTQTNATKSNNARPTTPATVTQKLNLVRINYYKSIKSSKNKV